MIKLSPKYLNGSRETAKGRSKAMQAPHTAVEDREEMQAADDRDDLASSLQLQYLKLTEEIKLL